MALAWWPNGKEVTEDEAIEVLMVWFGEDGKTAKEDLFTISREALQRAVNYYAEKYV